MKILKTLDRATGFVLVTTCVLIPLAIYKIASDMLTLLGAHSGEWLKELEDDVMESLYTFEHQGKKGMEDLAEKVLEGLDGSEEVPLTLPEDSALSVTDEEWERVFKNSERDLGASQEGNQMKSTYNPWPFDRRN